MTLKVSVIVLNYARPEAVLRCVKSVLASDYEDLEVVLVDNSLSGSILNVLDKEIKSKNVRVVRLGRNAGYSGGNNAGIRSSTGSYILIINDDVIIDRSLISGLVDIMEAYPSIGIAGPIVYRLGTDEVWGYNPRIKELDVDLVDVVFVLGCALMIRRKVIEKIGLLDENFFLYHEEWDWCIRARKAGYKTVCATRLKVWHEVQPPPAEIFYSHAAYFGQRNYFLLAAKHCKTSRKAFSFLFKYLVYGDHTLRLLFVGLALKNKKFKALQSYFKGIINGVVMYLKIRLSSTRSRFG